MSEVRGTFRFAAARCDLDGAKLHRAVVLSRHSPRTQILLLSLEYGIFGPGLIVMPRIQILLLPLRIWIFGPGLNVMPLNSDGSYKRHVTGSLREVSFLSVFSV